MADNAFQMLQPSYPSAEFRLCEWHVKQNMKIRHLPRKDLDAYSKLVKATTESEAEEAWLSLTEPVSSCEYRLTHINVVLTVLVLFGISF